MKRLTALLILSLFFLQNLKPQDSLKPKQAQSTQPVYSIRLYLPGGQNMKVWLMDIRDSSIYVFQKQSSKADPLHKHNMNDTSAWDKYDYKYVVRIKIMDKKLRTWSVLGGMIIGFGAGYLIASNRTISAGLSGIGDVAGNYLIVILGTGVGAVAGAIVASSIEKKYQIDGDWKKLEEMKAALHY